MPSFRLAEPQFEPQRVHSVKVVSEQPFVSDKTQVLVQLQGRLVGDFGLQHNLGGTQQGSVLTVTWSRKRFLGPLGSHNGAQSQS